MAESESAGAVSVIVGIVAIIAIIVIIYFLFLHGGAPREGPDIEIELNSLLVEPARFVAAHFAR